MFKESHLLKEKYLKNYVVKKQVSSLISWSVCAAYWEETQSFILY